MPNRPTAESSIGSAGTSSTFWVIPNGGILLLSSARRRPRAKCRGTPFPTILLKSPKWSIWGLAASEKLADFAPTIILKAKDFATEITIFNAREHRMATEAAISREHVTNNEVVRKTLLERGIRPETLPAAEDVKKVERRLASEEKKSLENPESIE